MYKVSSSVVTVINGLSKCFSKLKEKFDLGPKSGLAQIPLPSSTKLLALDPYNSFARKEAVVSGFAWFNDKAGYFSGKLSNAKAKIVPNDRCQRKLTSPIQDSQLCAKIVEHDKDMDPGVCSVSTMPWHLLSYCSNNIVENMKSDYD